MLNNIKKVVSYARYSSDHQRVESIEIQQENIKKYCAGNGYQLEAEYKDEAKSGQSIVGRESFQKMLSDIKDKKVDCDAVVVYRYDRAGRNIYNMMNVYLGLNVLGVDFLSVKEPADNSPEGELMRNMFFALSQYEIQKMVSRMIDGKIKNAKSALHCGGIAPYGYDVVNKKLVINNEEAVGVKMIFEMYAEGKGYGEIAAALNEDGFLTKRKNNFVKNSIRSILENEKYTGKYIYNKREAKRLNPATGKKIGNSNRYKADSEVVKVNDSHEAIIDRELFENVRIRLAGYGHKGYATKENYVLNGLLKCKLCGKNLSGKISYGKDGKQYKRYICPNHTVKACELKAINCKDIDNHVLDNLLKEVFNDVSMVTNELNKFEKSDQDIKEKIKRYKKAATDKERQKSRMLNGLKNVTNDEISTNITDSAEKLHKEAIEFQDKAKALEIRMNVQYNEKTVASAIAELKSYIIETKSDNIKEFLKSYIEKIEVDNNTVEIHFRQEQEECA